MAELCSLWLKLKTASPSSLSPAGDHISLWPSLSLLHLLGLSSLLTLIHHIKFHCDFGFVMYLKAMDDITVYVCIFIKFL